MNGFFSTKRLLSIAWSAVCMLLLGFGCVPDNDRYHTYEELAGDLRELAVEHPDIALLSSIGKSVEGRDLWALKISGDVGSDGVEPTAVFLGGHHGREWISAEVPFLIASHLLENYDSDPDVRELVDGCELWFVPLVNPDGHQYSVTTNRIWRKNRRDNGDGTFGVDLNRNYGFQWGGKGSSGDTFSQVYRGPAPFSEPETRAVRDFVAAQSPAAVLSYHSYSQLILYPWCCTEDPAPDQTLLAELGQSMADEIFLAGGERYFPMQGSANYISTGNSMDWFYGELSIPAWEIELRSADLPPGFLLPADQIQETFEESLPAAIHLIRWIVNQRQSRGR